MLLPSLLPAAAIDTFFPSHLFPREQVRAVGPLLAVVNEAAPAALGDGLVSDQDELALLASLRILMRGSAVMEVREAIARLGGAASIDRLTRVPQLGSGSAFRPRTQEAASALLRYLRSLRPASARLGPGPDMGHMH